MSQLAELPCVAPDEDVIYLLRELLAAAEAGRLRGIALVTLLTHREIGHAYVGDFHDDVYSMLGALVSLQRRICEEKDA